LNFFFDANLPPQLARGVDALSRSEQDVERVVHLRDLFAGATKDVAWMSALQDLGDDWRVVSIDRFRKDHRAEREAIARAGLTVYVLDSQWASQPYWPKVARFMLWWPLLLTHARVATGGVHCVPWRHTSQARFKSM